MKLDESQTFSEQVKSEICFNTKNCTNFETIIFSCLKNIGEYDITSNCIELKTQYVSVVKFFKQFCNIDSKYKLQISISNKKTLKNNRTNYLLKFSSSNIDDLIAKLSLKNLNFNDYDFCKNILIGAFLSGGSVNNPMSKTYHLEFRTLSSEYKDMIILALQKFNLHPKLLEHHNKFVIYFKRSTEISDLLKIFNAQNSMFYLEDNRIERDMFNNLQRLVNLEVFNLNKTARAAIEQSKICQIIQTSVYYQTLNHREKIYCDIRANNNKASMQTMCSLMNQKLPLENQITKGSLTHIVKKMKVIYTKI